MKYVNRFGPYINFANNGSDSSRWYACALVRMRKGTSSGSIGLQIETNGLSHIASIGNGSKQLRNFYIDSTRSFISLISR